EIYESGTTVGGNGSPKGDGPRRVVSRDQVRRINSEDGSLILFGSRPSQGVVYVHCWNGITLKAADQYLFLIANLLNADTRSKPTQRLIGIQIRFSTMKRRRKYGPT